MVYSTLGPAFIGPFIISPLQAQTSVSGYVFTDSNGNNKRDKKEKSIPGVPVSNGRDMILTDPEGRFNLLAEFPHTLSLSAHTHTQYHEFFTRDDGWQQDTPHHHYNVGTTSGNWYSGELNEQGIPKSQMADGTEKGSARINFSGTGYTIDYKVAGKPEEYQMGVWMPKIIEQHEKVAGWVYVNFFIGHKNDVVEYRIDEESGNICDRRT